MCPWAVKHLCEWMTADVRACVRLSMHVQLCKAVGPGLRSRDTASLLADLTVPAPLGGGGGECRGGLGRVGVVGTETNLGHDRSTGGRGDA